MNRKRPIEEDRRACYYLRTSSLTNVGGDSDARQLEAIRNYAFQNDLDLVRGAYDADVKGSDPIQDRVGLSELLAYMQKVEVRRLIVEDSSRFSRDLIVQEIGHEYLKSIGIQLIPTDDPESFIEDSVEGEVHPTRVLVRQLLGAVRQFEKTSLVIKLRGARRRSREKSGKLTRSGVGKCEGRISLEERFPGLRERIIFLREEEKLGWEQLRMRLFEEGIRSERSTALSLSRVHAVYRAGLKARERRAEQEQQERGLQQLAGAAAGAAENSHTFSGKM